MLCWFVKGYLLWKYEAISFSTISYPHIHHISTIDYPYIFHLLAIYIYIYSPNIFTIHQPYAQIFQRFSRGPNARRKSKQALEPLDSSPWSIAREAAWPRHLAVISRWFSDWWWCTYQTWHVILGWYLGFGIESCMYIYIYTYIYMYKYINNTHMVILISWCHVAICE